MRFRGVTALVVCLLAGLLVTASAEAKKIRYAGQSSQGEKVVLQTNAKGKAQSFRISFQAKCRHSKISDGFQGFVAPFDRADYRGFSDGGRYRHHYDKYDTNGKFRVRVRGERIDRDRLKGTFDFSAKFFDHGKKFNSCRSRTIRWTVSR